MASRMFVSRLGAAAKLTAMTGRPMAVSPVRVAPLLARRNASGNSGYNEPTGNLFGEKPLKPGEKRQWEDWELIWYVGMFGGIAFGVVLYLTNDKEHIGSWAEKEARKRLDARGEWRYKPAEEKEV